MIYLPAQTDVDQDMAGFYFLRTPSWVDGITVGLALSLLVPALWYAILVFGDLAALAEGNPAGISMAPVTEMLRVMLLGTVLAVEVLLPASLYMDARTLRARGASWQPNPGTYALGGLLFPLSVVLAVYYLLRRSFAAVGG